MCLWVRMLAINIPKRMISRQNDMYELIIRWRWGNTYNEKNDSCNCGKEKGLGYFTFVNCNRPMRSKGVLVKERLGVGLKLNRHGWRNQKRIQALLT